MRLTKRLTAFLLTLALAFSLCPAASAAIVEPFEDVPADAYYAPAVEWALDAGVTDGIAPTRFGPDYTVTRGQAVTFLWRAMGQPEPEDTQCPFNDVNAGDFFYAPVLWAVENGITDGTSDTTFSPADTLTRAHIITFLWRTAGWPNDNGSELWYTDAVNWAREEDLLSGTARAFAPGDPCPRADVVTYLYRANEAGSLDWGDEEYEDFFDVPVEDMNEAKMLETLDEWIELDEAGMKDEDGYLALAEWPELMEYMADTADLLQEEGLLSSFACYEEDCHIRYTLRSGLVVIYEPPIREYKDCAGSGNVSTFEPYYSAKYFSDKKNAPTAFEARDKIVQLNIGYQYGTSLQDSSVTLASVKNGFQDAKAGIVIWLGHGCYDESSGPCIVTGEIYNEESLKDFNKEEDYYIIAGSDRVAVTGSWFRKVLPDHSLDGELILLGTCKSLKDDRLSEALRAKGAECVVGSDTSIYIPTLCSMTRDFIQELSTRDKDGRFTSATDAINKATAYGIHGSVLIGNLSLAFGHAYRLKDHNSTVAGTVVDRNTKQSIPNATVVCGGTTVQTDADGHFTITGLDETDSYTIKASAKDYSDSTINVMADKAGNVTVSLDPAGIIDLYVDLFPANATAKLYETNGSRDAEAILAAEEPMRKCSGSDASHWKMDGLYIGQEYLISVSAVDCDTINVFVKAALEPEATHISPERKPGPPPTRVTVTVTDSRTGRPVSGASVACLYVSNVKLGEGITDDNGECTVTLIRNDVSSVTLNVQKDGYESLTDTASISRNTTTGVSLSLKPLPAPDPDLPDPWADYRKIYTAEDLKAAGEEGYDGPAVLMNDISVSGMYLEQWNGYLEGNGHTVSNIDTGIGLAGPNTYDQNCSWLSSNRGTLRNIVFKNVSLDDDSGGAWSNYASLIHSNQGTIENCRIDSGSISITEHGTQSGAAAFVLFNEENAVFRNCVNRADVTVIQPDKLPAGSAWTYNNAYASGMVLWNAGKVEHCLNLSSVSAYCRSMYAYAGSILCDSGTSGIGSSGRYYELAEDCADLGHVSAQTGRTDGMYNYTSQNNPGRSGLGNYDSMTRENVLACWADVLNMSPGRVPA